MSYTLLDCNSKYTYGWRVINLDYDVDEIFKTLEQALSFIDKTESDS